MTRRPFKQFLQWETSTRDTIDFKKAYVDMAGDLVAGLLLSQIVYWHLPDNKTGRTRLRVRRDGHLWIAKGRADWWDEIRITPKQFDRACKILIDRGLVVKTNYRFNGLKTLHVRINEDRFMELWEMTIGTPPENPHKVRVKSVLTKGEDRSSLKVETGLPQKGKPLTESTTKTTDKEYDATTVVLTDDQQTAYDLLTTIPDMDPSIARYTVRVCNLNDVPSWVAAGKRARVDSQAALVIRRLLDHEPAPIAPEKSEYDNWQYLVQDEEQDSAERLPSYREQIMTRYDISPETFALWEKAKDELALQMTKATFDTWLRGTWLLRLENGQAVIGVKGSYAMDWLSNRLNKVIQRTLNRHLDTPVELAFEMLE